MSAKMRPAGVLLAACLVLVGSVPPGLEAQETKWDLLVSNNQGHSVKRFDFETGGFLGELVSPAKGGLNQTQEVLLGQDGNLLVAGIGPGAILSFDPRTGDYLGRFTSGYTLQQATKTRFGPDGNLYVSQWGSSQSSVAVFDGATGAFLREATPNIDRPMGQAWDADGVLHVTSFGSADVRSYDAEGNEIEVVIPRGGPLLGPVNIWFQDDELWIIDWTSGSIQRYDLDGTQIGVFASGLANPEGWAYGPDGALYIAEWTGNRVRRLDAATGATLGFLATQGGLQAPNDVFFIERFPDFSLATPNGSTTVTSDSDGSATVLVRPEGGIAFDASVELSCNSPSPRLACSASPSTVTPGADTLEVTVTFSKLATGTITGLTLQGPIAPGGGRWLVALLAIACLAVPQKRRLRPRWSLTSLAALLLVAGCGGSTTEPVDVEMETVQATVSARGDGLARTLTLTVDIR
ncbi:MAG: hypothetical protein BMS9Abin29_1201 [Gemmatimonadota bacterium]|nr:MAG: hypothetical protein BMS9Abin29_1201 [Gemmatimonadota bacterium]